MESATCSLYLLARALSAWGDLNGANAWATPGPVAALPEWPAPNSDQSARDPDAVRSPSSHRVQNGSKWRRFFLAT